MAQMCKHCGAWAEDKDRFCQQCGGNLMQDGPVEVVDAEIIRPARRHESPAADAREVRERLIGTKVGYYLPRFEKMEALNSFTDWNLAACILGYWWMLYRKMYVLGGVMWLIFAALTQMDATGLCFLLSVGMGVIGNFLYMKDIDHRTEKAMNMQPDEREAYIQKNSGTGWVGVISAAVLSIVIALIML